MVLRMSDVADERGETGEGPGGHVQRRAVIAALGVGIGGLGAAAFTRPDGSGTGAGAGSLESGGRLTPTCVLSPETVEGPYYVDEALVRRDITEDREGVPVTLRIHVAHATECTPIRGAIVDIWHCDAGGWYSGHLDTSPDDPPGGPGGPGGSGGPPPTGEPTAGDADDDERDDRIPPTDPSRFLRGTLRTDRHGAVEFRTIYPGWYTGRAIHIHLKVHVGGLEVHTGQLYFPEKLNEAIAALPPYAEHTGAKRLANEEDFIFVQQGGAQTVLRVTPARRGKPGLGLTASITAGVVPGQTPPEPTFEPPAPQG